MTYRPCKHCGKEFSAMKLQVHLGVCPKNPMVAICSYCGLMFNRIQGLRRHIAASCVCPPLIPKGCAVCTLCQKVKPLEEFSLDRSRKDGRQPCCKPCDRAEKSKYYSTTAGRLSQHLTHAQHSYGIGREEYRKMVESQDGRCAICRELPRGGKRETHLHIDHDHVTGKIRSLLCYRCNHALGCFQESPAILIAAMNYLLRYQGTEIVT